MIKSVRTATLLSALLFSMGAIAQSGGGNGNPTQNMGRDNPDLTQPGGTSDSSSSTTTAKPKMKHKKSSDKSSMKKTPDGTGSMGNTSPQSQ